MTFKKSVLTGVGIAVGLLIVQQAVAFVTSPNFMCDRKCRRERQLRQEIYETLCKLEDLNGKHKLEQCR